MDSLKRSVAKAISWRIWATLETGAVSWLISGSLKIALGIMSLEAVLKIFTYFIHERIWNRIGFGRPSSQDYQI